MEKSNINTGWISLHRELLGKPIWTYSTPEQKTILITLLLMANHSHEQWEWKGDKYHCEPGQFITSLDSIAVKSGKGISIQNVRTALLRFEKYGFLTNESTNKNRLITICNWGHYQTNDKQPNKQHNKQPTSNQQAANKQLTTNNNDNNDNNDNNERENARILSPKISEKVKNTAERDLKDVFKEIDSNEKWKQDMCRMHNIPGSTLEIKLINFTKLMNEFYDHLSIELQVKTKSISDTYYHFSNWLNRRKQND